MNIKQLWENYSLAFLIALFLAGWFIILSMLPEHLRWRDTAPLLIYTLACFIPTILALRKAWKRNDELSIADPLTGLYTERFFYRALKLEFKRSTRYRLPLSLVIFSIDELGREAEAYGKKPKEINKLVLKTISSTIRESDIFSALEQDKYSLLLPNTPVDGAQTAANRVMSKIRTELQKLKLGRHISVPFGICGIQEREVTSSEELFAGSAQAYAAARVSPRNKIVVCGAECR